jgi:hypothetical protein
VRYLFSREDIEFSYQKFVGLEGNGLDTYIESKRNLNKIYDKLFGQNPEK